MPAAVVLHNSFLTGRRDSRRIAVALENRGNAPRNAPPRDSFRACHYFYGTVLIGRARKSRAPRFRFHKQCGCCESSNWAADAREKSSFFFSTTRPRDIDFPLGTNICAGMVFSYGASTAITVHFSDGLFPAN